jgi:hypothetical protein
MHRSVRSLSVAAFTAALAGLTCSFPTDKSDQVRVLVTPSDSLRNRGVVQRGSVDTVHARAFRLKANGDTIAIPNVDFAWESSDKNLARVEGVGGGAAEVTGVNAGYAVITARAIPFDKAQAGADTLRVANPFVIDSVRPTTIAYGGKVKFFGVGINQIAFAELGFADLIPDFFSITGQPSGVGTYSFWVPTPASSSQPFIIGPGIFGTAGDSVTVLTHDIYEPDSLAPAPLDINGTGGPRTFQGFPMLFFNPALFYEPVGLGGQDVDWFRFLRTDTTLAVTFILNSTVFNDTAFAYLSDSLYYSAGGYFIGDSAWIISPGFYTCKGQFFFPNEPRAVSTIIALKSLPTRSIQLLSFYAKSGRYELAAVRGYVTSDKRIGPDRFEENDIWCKYADDNFVRIPINIGPLSPFADSTLTIDNPHDIDWYKFRVLAGGLTDTVTIQTKPRPFSAVDPSDIDLYVYQETPFTFKGSVRTAGSFEKLKLLLPPNDYLLAVVDVAAVPTRYSVCFVKNNIGCVPPGSAPLSVMAPRIAALRAELDRQARGLSPTFSARLTPGQRLPSPRP